jgi:hypothetical protein
VGKLIGAQSRPGSFKQFFWWFPQFLPTSKNTQIAGVAAICWAIWKLRNCACFEHKLKNNHVELISYSTVFMKYWVGLHGEKDADDLKAGADGLLRLASAINFGTAAPQDGSRKIQRPLRIRDASMDTGDDDMEQD